MSTSKSKSMSVPGPRSLWSGLLLGFLLTTFVAALIFVAYLFLSWGQSALAQAPNLPPLELPKLVRPATSSDGQVATTLSTLFQPASSRSQESTQTVTGRVTVLIMGVDARPKQTYMLTDSIIVLTLNPQTQAAGMLSIPRDLLVRPTSINREVKINMVHPIGEDSGVPGGGPALLQEAIEELTGYPIDYYVRINFEGFKKIIDLIGGVDIDVPYDIVDHKYPTENYGIEELRISKGLQHMDGELALKYARTRHADSDYRRADRQQQVIMAIKNKVTQPGMMASLLPRLPGLAIAMANSVQTDMPVEKALALARTVDKLGFDNLTRVVIDQKMGQVNTNYNELGYVLIPDMNKLHAAAAAIFADAPTGPTTAEAERQVVQAEAARIIVLNGTQEKGLAAKTQATLITNGFDVATVGNADRVDYAETWLVSHGDTKPATVEALARWFNIPPARIRSDPPSDAVDVTLIVGQDQIETAPSP